MSKKKQSQRRQRTPGTPDGAASVAVVRPPEPVPRGRPFDYSMDGASVSFTMAAELPAPTIVESQKYPWTPWWIGYAEKRVERDAKRLLQTLANLRAVTASVERRQAAREAAKASRQPEQPRQQAAAVASGPVQ